MNIELKVTNHVGLHARPAALFVKNAGQFRSEIFIRNSTTRSDWVNAKSILDVLTLGVEQNHIIEVKVEGEDESHALKALKELVERDFSV